MTRSYHGLDVVGGDLVVHQTAAGAWKGASLTLDSTLALATTPTVSSPAASARALAPSAATRHISGLRADGSTLVVDALGATPRLAWKVLSGGTQADGTPSRLATYVDARTGKVLHTEQEIENVSGTGKTLYSGTVPLSVTQSGSTYQLKNAGVRGNTYTTDMKNASDSYSVPGARQRVQERDADHQQHDHVRQRPELQPRHGGCRRAVRQQRDLGLLQDDLRPQRHLRHRQRVPTTGSTTARTTSTPSGTAPR